MTVCTHWLCRARVCATGFLFFFTPGDWIAVCGLQNCFGFDFVFIDKSVTFPFESQDLYLCWLCVCSWVSTRTKTCESVPALGQSAAGRSAKP